MQKYKNILTAVLGLTLMLLGAIILYGAGFKQMPAPEAGVAPSSMFLSPEEGEVWVMGETRAIAWQGSSPSTRSLRLVASDESKGAHGVVISTHTESLLEVNELEWEIACDTFAPGTYKLFFEDEATGEYLQPSAPFVLEKGPSCS